MACIGGADNLRLGLERLPGRWSAIRHCQNRLRARSWPQNQRESAQCRTRGGSRVDAAGFRDIRLDRPGQRAFAPAVRGAASVTRSSGWCWLFLLSPCRTPCDAAGRGTLARVVPLSGGPAHATDQAWAARLFAAAIQSAAADRRSCDARPDLGWAAGTGGWPRRRPLRIALSWDRTRRHPRDIR